MSATLLGSSTGATFGCTAETGILITSFSVNTTSDKVEVKDETGSVKLVAVTNPRSAISLSGTVAGTTGVAAAAVGVALTLANSDTIGGVSAGINIVDSVQLSKTQNGFKTIAVTATRYPQITS